MIAFWMPLKTFSSDCLSCRLVDIDDICKEILVLKTSRAI